MRSFRLWQRENVQRVSGLRMSDFWRQLTWHASRTATAQPRRDGDILPPIHAVRNGKPLSRGREARLPQDFPGSHVVATEIPVEIAGEDHVAAGRQRRRQKGGPLRDAPD